MTKKEIIRNLKYTMEKHKNDRVDTFGTNISLMCKDILDYLEKEPCGKDINVPAEDAISRQMAIDALGECPMVWMDSDAEITAERDWKDTVEMLKSLPSVTPQPKTEVLDKIRAEVDTQEEWLSEAGYTAYNVDIAFSSIKRVIAESRDK